MNTTELFVSQWISKQDPNKNVNDVYLKDFYAAYIEFCMQTSEKPLDKIRLGQAVWNKLLPGGKVMCHAIEGKFRRLPSVPDCRKWFELSVLQREKLWPAVMSE